MQSLIKYQKSNNKKRGKLIVFEGLSGSGKTESAKLLAEELRERGYRVNLFHVNSFDNALIVKLHSLLNEIKQGASINLNENKRAAVNIPSYQKKQYPVDYQVIHTLFMTYIFSLRAEILYKLSVCDYVIVDQWIYKNIVYAMLHRVTKGYIGNLCRNVLPRPFLVIFLDLHEKESVKRGHDMYEDEFSLREIKTNYYILRKNAKENWLTINLNGNESIEDIVYKMILPKIRKNI